MDSQTYSVAALSAAVGVPRTTINDWLTRYEDYIDSSTSGKRKVYSAQSLAVLQEIAGLRDAGKSSAEIENILAARHGVKPEVAPEAAPAVAAEKNPIPDAGTTPEPVSTLEPDAAQLPAIKEFERNAMELTAFIADLRNQHRRSSRRAAWAIALLVVLTVLLLAVVICGVRFYQQQAFERRQEALKMQESVLKMQQEFVTALQNQEQARQQEQAVAQNNIAQLKAELLKLHQLRAAEVTRLEQQLAADRAALQAELKAQEKSLNDQRLNERKLLLEKMEKDAQNARTQLETLQSQLASADKNLLVLTQKLREMSEKPAPVLPAAPAPATPADAAPAVPAGTTAAPEKK